MSSIFDSFDGSLFDSFLATSFNARGDIGKVVIWYVGTLTTNKDHEKLATYKDGIIKQISTNPPSGASSYPNRYADVHRDFEKKVIMATNGTDRLQIYKKDTDLFEDQVGPKVEYFTGSGRIDGYIGMIQILSEKTVVFAPPDLFPPFTHLSTDPDSETVDFSYAAGFDNVNTYYTLSKSSNPMVWGSLTENLYCLEPNFSVDGKEYFLTFDMTYRQIVDGDYETSGDLEEVGSVASQPFGTWLKEYQYDDQSAPLIIQNSQGFGQVYKIDPILDAAWSQIINTNADVYDAAVYEFEGKKELIIVGAFTSANMPTISDGSSTLRGVGMWNPTDGLRVMGSGFDGTAFCVHVDEDNTLLVGGAFTGLFGGPANGCRRLAKWNGQEWEEAIVNLQSATGVTIYKMFDFEGETK